MREITFTDNKISPFDQSPEKLAEINRTLRGNSIPFSLAGFAPSENPGKLIFTFESSDRKDMSDHATESAAILVAGLLHLARPGINHHTAIYGWDTETNKVVFSGSGPNFKYRTDIHVLGSV